MKIIETKKYYLEIKLGCNGSGDTIYCLQGHSKATGEKIFEKFNTQAEALNWVKYAY